METQNQNMYMIDEKNLESPYKTQNKYLFSFETIYDKYKTEFIDNCEEIIIQKEQDFLNFFFSRMKIILKEFYGENNIESNSDFKKNILKCEKKFTKEIYKNMYNLCSNAWKKFNQNSAKKNISKNKDIYLTNYRSHCYYDQVPFHICKGRFINVTDPSSNNSKPLYVICSNCKMCYYESSILMYCINCKKEFYSSIIPVGDKILPPATWEKYHCNALINEQMSCIKCGDKFWIKNSNLFCKKCKLLISPLDVIWTCIICHKEFKSYAKIYNPLEYKLVKLGIRNAKLNRKITKPKEVPCGCLNKKEIENTTFYHKLNGKCNGVLYYGTISGKGIVVCSLCKSISTLNKFNWYCPQCQKTFITKNVNIYSIEDNNSNCNNNNYELNNNTNSLSNTTTPSISKKTTNNEDYNKNTNGSRNSKEIHNLKSINNKNDEERMRDLHDKLINNAIPNYEYQDNNKRRNLSISLMNKQISKSKVNLRSSNNTGNYDNSLDDEDEYNERKHIIRHPTKRIGHLSITKNNNNNIFNNSLRSQRINSNEQKDDGKGSRDSINNYNGSNRYSNNYKNFQVYIPKRTINLFNTKNDNDSNNSSKRKGSSIDKNSDYSDNDSRISGVIPISKGINRFRLNYQSPSSERKNLQVKFNGEETDHREKVRELSKKKNERKESPNEKIEFENEFYKSDINNNGKTIINMRGNLQNNYFLDNEKLKISVLSKSPGQENNKLKNNYFVIDKNKDFEKNDLIKSDVFINKNKDLKDYELDNELKPFNFNDFTIITQLGQGTFGKIYLVQNSKGEVYSMKKIFLSEELDLEDIIREYRLCYKLKNDNIVEIIGLHNTKLDSTTFIVYILMEVGLTDWEKEIRTYSEKSKSYSEEELISIIKQLVSALSFLQKKNVSHRDIKPHNVLVFKDKIYKIADFGEAKQITKVTQNLQINTLRGTEMYMSPLLFNGLRTNQIDIKHNLFKSDVYSLGLCILYACTLTNEYIYDIRKYVDMNDVRKFINKCIGRKYSKKFVELIENMLEINERNRPDFIELEKKMENW